MRPPRGPEAGSGDETPPAQGSTHEGVFRFASLQIVPRPGPRSGYLLTGDPEELDASRAGRVELLARLESLHALVAQDPSHKGLVTRFEELARARLAVLDRVVEFHEVGRSEAAAALISDEGKRLMAEARATIGTLMAQEGGELRHRSAEAAEAAEADQRVQNIYIILFVMGLGLVLAAASLSLEVSQAMERAKSAEALEAVNASLEARVREAVEENRQAAQQIFEMQKLETLGSLTGA